jgi:hypothetical protein
MLKGMRVADAFDAALEVFELSFCLPFWSQHVGGDHGRAHEAGGDQELDDNSSVID